MESGQTRATRMRMLSIRERGDFLVCLVGLIFRVRRRRRGRRGGGGQERERRGWMWSRSDDEVLMMKEKALKDSTPVSYRIVCSVLFSAFFFFCLSLKVSLVARSTLFSGCFCWLFFFLALLYIAIPPS
ncbi:uncharacterized protein C8R40DRAFT_817611 [Lentinula edodes]|uniref:uncharacterized protein n=1 Tax=Lentinula edodes TaxID=5353 RepID=UPI001E8E782C|nr:uncharacterized protein C8R40DRAFT_817611 [Lentinula edodes]KAH7868634.1 hypothetical protein C8R40DRAFT_817611 [Lentinula edodes]